MIFTMAEAKRDLSVGYLSEFSVQKQQSSSGWTIWLKGAAGIDGTLVNQRDKSPRVFKTLDAAISALNDIGFDVQETSGHKNKNDVNAIAKAKANRERWAKSFTDQCKSTHEG